MHPSRTEILGRSAEVGALEAAIGAAGERRGTVTMVVGEPGIGKSRLARHAAEVARAANVTTRWGRCWESGGQPAYWPWVQIIRGLVRDRSDDEALVDLGTRGADIARLDPELAARFPRLEVLPALQGADARFRLFDAIAGFLAASAERTPLLLILEDLHAADRSSAELLAFVARHIDTAPIAIVGTYRDADARVAGLSDLLSKAERCASTLQLRPLSELEVRELVMQLAGDQAVLDEQQVRAIQSSSGGVPLFVEELVRRGPSSHAVPEGIAAVIRERLAKLPDATRALLSRASITGRVFELKSLARATGSSAEVLEAELQPALAADVLVGEPGGPYRFAHMLVREALYRDVPPTERMAWHQDVARAISAESDRAAANRLAEVAHHLGHGGPAVASEAVLAYRAAADRATSLFAFEEAVDLLSRALEIQLEAAPEDASAQCEMRIALGHALISAGRSADGQAICAEAAAQARTLGDSRLFAEAAIGFGTVYSLGRTDERLVALLREAIERLEATDDRLRALCQARLAAALQPADDPRVPIAMAKESIALARRTGDDRVLLDTIRSAASAMMDLDEPRVRAEVNREHVELARRLGDTTELLRGCARLVFDYVEMGDVFSADAMVNAYQQTAATVSHPKYEWQSLSLRAMRMTMRGEFSEARALLDRASSLATSTGDPSSPIYTLHQQAGLAYSSCNDEWLREILADTRFLFGLQGKLRNLLCASMLAHVGEHDQVRQLMEGLSSSDFLVYFDPHLLSCLAEVTFSLADRELAVACCEPLQRMAHRNASWGMICMTCDAPLERALALCESVRGDLAGATRHFESAAKRAREMGAPAMVARIEYEHAVALRLADPSSAEASRLLTRARAAAAGLGMDGLVRRIDRQTEGQPLPPPTDAPAPAATCVRDGDTWLLEHRDAAVRVKDSKGMQILARLVAEPHREFHVLDLSSGSPTIDAGDAGPMLDDAAVATYRARVRELRELVEEAESWNDTARAEKAREELEFIAAELSRAVGVGGRARAAGNAAERARVNVRKRIQHAIKSIDSQDHALGQYLTRTIRTGVFCSFEPV